MTDFPKVPEGILGEETTEKTNTELFLSLVGQYFPEAIKDGEVDFTALKEEMGEFPQVSSEHYDFTWAGKQAAKKEAMSDIYGRTLKYKPQDSLNPDTTENIYIEGDNLEALKLLRRNYHGKIKMIYIDPPYNTGNDFVYHDDFSMTEEELAKKSGDVVDGVRYQKNGKDTAKYHTNWLNMMYPRLKIARELLSDDGVIFISIDDNEVDNLKKIANEIYGEKNFVFQISWRRTDNQPNIGNVARVKEYILCYAKSISDIVFGKLPMTDKAKNEYRYEDEKGKFRRAILLDKTRGRHFYPIKTKSGNILNGPWMKTEEEFKKLDSEGLIYWTSGRDEQPYGKIYLDDNKGQIANDFWGIEFGTNQRASIEVEKLFGKRFFDFPKPVSLLCNLIRLGSNEDDIVLDFFSGSATTAHAVIQQNFLNVYNHKPGNIKFILVQLPELCGEKTEAYKAGYKNICEIGKERIRRAGQLEYKSICATSGSSMRWDSERRYSDKSYICPENVDIGFKVFEVADTNIRWNTADDEEIQRLDETDYGNDKERTDFTKGYTDIDVVYEIMLRQFDIPLSTPIEKLSSVSDRTYIFADAVVVCLEPEITTELIEKLAAIEPNPAKFVLRDSAFNDDIQLKDVSFRRLSALIKNHQTEEERKSKYNNYTVEFI